MSASRTLLLLRHGVRPRRLAAELAGASRAAAAGCGAVHRPLHPARVTYVHERKVLHLDLKPANILLSNESVIKVADFGLARLINQGEANAGSQPKAGTPLYMSPEQVLGAKLDERSDIFSLGVLIYQLLAGKTPFTGIAPTRSI